VSRACTGLKNLWINALAVVPDAQPKLPLIIPDLHFDPRRVCQGFAFERSIAINPIAQLPHKTTFHELAHIMLGHTEEGQLVDSDLTPLNIREAEAESVALICCESLQLAGAEYARGYIQTWLAGETISDRSAQKIFSAASAILKAGRGESASRETG
jgi:hypothetical protein